jgi:hypothetical protein
LSAIARNRGSDTGIHKHGQLRPVVIHFYFPFFISDYGIQTRKEKQPESTDSDSDVYHSFYERIKTILIFVMPFLLLCLIYRLTCMLTRKDDKRRD